jgi:glutamate N-acetyltransferase/amino-acid N-acetyltransferase
MTDPINTFTFAPGFRAAAVACGLKTSSVMGASDLDLALVSADIPCSAAGVFTTNRVKAAPVLYDQQVLASGAAEIRAVITNAGNANAVTGPRGMDDARAMAAATAEALGCRPDQVLVLSTGVIGRHLPMDKVTSGIAAIATPSAFQGAPYVAQAIMTTDTRPKVASRQLAIGDGTITISGCCKGSGMIHPNMATLLAIVTTDAQLPPDALQVALASAVAQSFNRISVDGDTSTNDTLLLLASGASGVAVSGGDMPAFVAMLTEVCIDLAKQVARDGEGATRLIEIRVTGADSEAQAHMVANSIARSPLVKTAVHGGDPNWGRVLCAAGYSGAAIDPERISLSFGPADRPGEKYDSPEVQVLASGLPTVYDERAARAALVSDPALITLDLGLGAATATVWTCDLTAEYIAINAHYTT